jgi:hydrogen peroxide-dependent heme synthase
MPEVPETLEGWYALHDFRLIDWPRWKALPAEERRAAVEEAREFLRAAQEAADAEEGSSALYRVAGHKADLMFLHLRPAPDDLERLERAFARARLADYTSRPYSYVSVTELGLYEAQARGGLGDRDPMEIPFIRARLKFRVPDDKPYMVFYPMSKRRGEHENWFMLPMEERRAMMRSHGTVGHKYFNVVQQMITGSVGFDDWEWGVTLFTREPLQFKKLVYEMRFDEVSARFAEFGPFLLGMRVLPDELGELLDV